KMADTRAGAAPLCLRSVRKGLPVGTIVNLPFRARDLHAGEQTLGLRVGVDLRLCLVIGGGGYVAPYRSGSHRCRHAEVERIRRDRARRVPVDEDQHDVGRLRADLQAEAAALETDVTRHAPTGRSSTAHQSEPGATAHA